MAGGEYSVTVHRSTVHYGLDLFYKENFEIWPGFIKNRFQSALQGTRNEGTLLGINWELWPGQCFKEWTPKSISLATMLAKQVSNLCDGSSNCSRSGPVVFRAVHNLLPWIGQMLCVRLVIHGCTQQVESIKMGPLLTVAWLYVSYCTEISAWHFSTPGIL